MKYLLTFAGAFGICLIIIFVFRDIDILIFNRIYPVFFVFGFITNYILPWIILYFVIKIARK